MVFKGPWTSVLKIHFIGYLRCKKTGSHCRTAEGGVAELGEVGGADSQEASGKESGYTLVGCASYRTNTSEQALSHQEQQQNTIGKSTPLHDTLD